MSTATAIRSHLFLSPEIDAFALEKGLAPFLPLLVDALERIFSGARQMKAGIHQDPEEENLRWIMFEVEVPWSSNRVLEASAEWYRTTAEICPAPLLGEFGLLLNPVAE